MNYNLHDSLDAKAQRLLNAGAGHAADTPTPPYGGTYIVLRGSIRVMFYNEAADSRILIDPKEKEYGIHSLPDSGTRWKYWKAEP